MGEKGACDLSVPATHLHDSPLGQCLSHSSVQQTTWDLVTSQALRRSEAGPGIHAPRCCWYCWSEDALSPTLVPEDRILGACRMRWHRGDTEPSPCPGSVTGRTPHTDSLSPTHTLTPDTRGPTAEAHKQASLPSRLLGSPAQPLAHLRSMGPFPGFTSITKLPASAMPVQEA